MPRDIRRAAGLKPGDAVTFESKEAGVVVIRALPVMSLEEALEKYRVEGPVNDAADREEWQDVAAAEVLGAQPD